MRATDSLAGLRAAFTRLGRPISRSASDLIKDIYLNILLLFFLIILIAGFFQMVAVLLIILIAGFFQMVAVLLNSSDISELVFKHVRKLPF